MLRTLARGSAVSRRDLIVFAVPDFEPSVGGTTRQTGLQARALARRGHDVVVVTRRLHASWPKRERLGGVEVIRVGPTGRGRTLEARSLAALLRWLIVNRRRIRVVQVVMWPDAPLAAAAAGLASRTAVLWAIRGEIGMALDPLRRGRAAIRRAALARAVQVTLTPRMAHELVSAGLTGASTIIPVPVDIAHFRPPTAGERAEARRTLAVREGDFVVVYVGHLQARKAVDRLVSAFDELRRRTPARLLLVGGGRGAPDDTEAELRDYVARHDLGAFVTFCGVASDPRPYLWAADVLALASVREGMPNSLLEGLAVGLPCVAPASAGGDEILDAEVGVIPPSNEPEALAAALAELAADPELGRGMAGAARRRAEQFDIERIADEYELLYERMAPS